MDNLTMNPNMDQKQSKVSVGGRIGYFFLALLPIVISFMLQVGCLIVIVLVEMILKAMDGTLAGIGTNSVEFMNFYTDLVYSKASLGMFVYHVVGILAFGLWYYLSFKKPRPTLRQSFKMVSGKSIIVSVIGGLALGFFANGTVILESIFLPSIVERFNEMAEIAGLGTDVWAIIAAIILAPIGEELLCRGLALKFAEKSFGKFWIANVMQALLFGVLHANWVQGIYAFGIGLFLGWLVKRYKTILPAMLVHFVINFSNSTWMGYVMEPIEATVMSGMLLTLVPVVIMVALIIWEQGKKKLACLTFLA